MPSANVLRAKQAAEFTMGREYAGNAQAIGCGQLLEVDKKIVRKLVKFKKRTQLHVGDLFLSQQAKQPIVRITVFDRIGLKP
jgi:hypothetical protein